MKKLETFFNGNIEDISVMLVCAERYALGRQTYIVQWVCEFISNNLHLLIPKDIKVMIRDIENCGNYGWDCDKNEWMKLLNVLKNSVDENKGI